ncbi:MAG: YaeQ family protein [Pseudolysinimonas sp.]
MAAGAVIYNFTAQLADVDRGVYEDLTLRVAQHPSETDAYMVTRVLAYCLEYVEGIAFSEGISSTDEPAVLVRDRTGRLTTWIEVGAPDAARLHFGSKLADRTTIYTHRDPQKVIGAWSGKKIHQLEQIIEHHRRRARMKGSPSATASRQPTSRPCSSVTSPRQADHLDRGGRPRRRPAALCVRVTRGRFC